MDLWFERELSALLPVLHVHAFRLTRRNRQWADDLVQDTVVNAILGSHRFTQGTNMRAWLKTIMRHVFSDHLKAINRERVNISLDDDPDFAEALASVPPDISGLLLDDADRLLSLLPEEQRQAVVLTCVHGMSVDDAADQLGVPAGTIKTRIHRARVRMTKALQADKLPARTHNVRSHCPMTVSVNDPVSRYPEDKSLPAGRKIVRP